MLPGETDMLINRFKQGIEHSKQTRPNMTMYEHCKSSLFGVFWRDWIYTAIIAIIAECTGVYLSIYIYYLGDYIMDDKQHYTRGIG